MTKRMLVLALVLSLVPAAAALAQWAPNGASVCAAASDQTNPVIVSDGAGGAIIAWQDYRSLSSYDIYVQRVNAKGAPLWSSSGVAICTATGHQLSPVIISDGAGGAIIAWYDARSGNYDIYAQRVNPSGVTQWNSHSGADSLNGLPVCTASSDQQFPSLTSDGAGGAIITWQDNRTSGSTGTDIYAQRMNASGVAQWNSHSGADSLNGVAICAIAPNQTYPAIVSDGAGGAIITWQDDRGDIYTQRVNYAGTVEWTANGVDICMAVNNQYSPTIVSDGAGGAIITWYDARRSGSAPFDIYAQRVNTSGSALWTANGVAISSASSLSCTIPTIASDCMNGAVITWQGIVSAPHIYAQRVNASGAAQWNTHNGADSLNIPICTACGGQQNPVIASDGAGGAIITWQDTRYNGLDIFAQRVNTTGAMQWTTDGVAVCNAVNNQQSPKIVPDGSGLALITWMDFRSGASGTGCDIFAQRADKYDGSYAGYDAPAIVTVKDVPNDQGGSVDLEWTPSPMDAYPCTTISFYSVWRSLSGAKLAGMESQGIKPIDPSGLTVDFAGPGYRMATKNGTTYAWEWIANLPWRQYLPRWSYTAPTLCDSGPGGKAYMHYMVSAQTRISLLYWDSDPDSGFSVDNLPPAKVKGLTGDLLKGPVRLHWKKNTEVDLAGYIVYRDGGQIGTATDTIFTDTPAGTCGYAIKAQDIHGNLSLASDEWHYSSMAIMLSQFTAMETEDGMVSIRWLTESEQNCLRWEIERAGADGSAYSAIGTVNGHGNSNQPVDYSFTDKNVLSAGMYYYRMTEVDLSGVRAVYGPISVNYLLRIPAVNALAEARPNPFWRETMLHYQLAKPSRILLRVFNVSGQLVKTVAEGQQQPGYHTVNWDGRDQRGELVSSGMYLYTLTLPGGVQARKVLVLR